MPSASASGTKAHSQNLMFVDPLIRHEALKIKMKVQAHQKKRKIRHRQKIDKYIKLKYQNRPKDKKNRDRKTNDKQKNR